jgi:hypothetical protein
MTERDRDEETLRAALRDLRDADERAAPDFDAVISRAALPSYTLNVGRLAIAAGLLVAAVGVSALFARRPKLTVPTEVIALSTWRPATDVLLETSTRELLRHTPRLGASLIDISNTGELP